MSARMLKSFIVVGSQSVSRDRSSFWKPFQMFNWKSLVCAYAVVLSIAIWNIFRSPTDTEVLPQASEWIGPIVNRLNKLTIPDPTSKLCGKVYCGEEIAHLLNGQDIRPEAALDSSNFYSIVYEAALSSSDKRAGIFLPLSMFTRLDSGKENTKIVLSFGESILEAEASDDLVSEIKSSAQFSALSKEIFLNYSKTGVVNKSEWIGIGAAVESPSMLKLSYQSPNGVGWKGLIDGSKLNFDPSKKEALVELIANKKRSVSSPLESSVSDVAELRSNVGILTEKVVELKAAVRDLTKGMEGQLDKLNANIKDNFVSWREFHVAVLGYLGIFTIVAAALTFMTKAKK